MSLHELWTKHLASNRQIIECDRIGIHQYKGKISKISH